jgi:hypothetical protein
VRCLRLLSVCLAAGILSGCAGYKLGPTNGLQAGTRSVQISPFVNQTFEPRLGDAVTTALRKALQQDGTFRLSTRAGADIVVSGVVTKYTHQELSFVPQDVLTVRDFRVGATVQVTARDISTGNILLDRPVTGYTLVRVGSDLTSAERQALGPLADELARKVTALLVDGTW